MGFLKWIKRELDTSSGCKRRQSEPPLSINRSAFSRDESYIKALSKFNEWRHRQIFGSSTKLSRKSFRKSLRKKRNSKVIEEETATPNEVEEVDEEQDSLECLSTDNDITNPVGYHNYYEEILQQRTEEDAKKAITARHSFPVNRIQRNKVIKDSPQGERTIYENEIFEFENHCLQQSRSLDDSENVSSPPVKFYKENSNPFANVLSPLRTNLYATPTRLFYSNSFDSSSSQDNKIVAYPSIESKPIDCESSPAKKERLSQKYLPYQTVINKHGDEVEYALPFNEKLDDDEEVEEDFYDTSSAFRDQSKDTNDNEIILETTKGYQQYVDDNFKFLNLSKPEFVPVTDLDKTDVTTKNIEQTQLEDNAILQEIESLEMWSKSIGICQSAKRVSIEPPIEQDLHNTELLVCTLNSIKLIPEIANQVSQNYINGNFYSGTFHNVPVTQFVPHSDGSDNADKMLRLNFDVLRKIRHPDIALLMGVSAESNGKLNSLILEPLKCSLNHLIHREKTIIPLSDCMSYINQINKAATYIHESGWIHSNISSHSIMVCQHQNIVKLTSFELAVKTDEKIRSNISHMYSGSLENLKITEICRQFLPHYINYRQMYSEHFYQSPELLATESKFVFPTKQADIYGIVLTLWELLNCSVPFALFTYDDMKKLFYLKHAQLPIFKQERCIPFENILQKGLEINSEDRIRDTLELSEMLEKVVLTKNNTTSGSDGFPLLSPKTCGKLIYERTSTIKKRKNVLEQNRISAKQLFISNMKTAQECDMGPTADYQFDIGEITLPDTPIARNNKLRKTAWLANKSISPIVHLAPIDEKKISNSNSPSTKKYKVNITIFQKDTHQEDDVDAINKSNISHQIKYWNALSVASTPNNHTQTESEEVRSVSPTDNNAEEVDAIENVETLNEVFYKNQLSSVNDFENSLWRREKKKCEESISLVERNGVLTPRRVSVKDAVNKFESFSKSFSNDLSEKNLSQRVVKNNSVLSKPMIVISDVAESETNSKTGDEINVSKLNVTLQNNMEENIKRIPSNLNNLPRLSVGGKFPENQPMLLTLNFKKLDRRASDVGSYFVQPNALRRDRTARHSIYGTEIFKRLNKTKIAENGVKTDSAQMGGGSKDQGDLNNFENSKKDFKIKVGKLTCLNCGHKLFVVDDVERNDGNDAGKGPRSELFLTPLKRYNGLQTAKSTEDLYIDDDFCEDLELGANMELGTRSEIFDFIDFDILAAEIFNPSEEIAILNSNISEF